MHLQHFFLDLSMHILFKFLTDNTYNILLIPNILLHLLNRLFFYSLCHH